MQRAYKQKTFRRKSLDQIKLINQVIYEYKQAGFELTLRQVYYQLVARGYIPNTEKSYKNTGKLISEGRLAGLIDWNGIGDRTRYLRSNSHWSSPKEVIRSAADCYSIDKWSYQFIYSEVWIEKDALIEIVAQACEPLDVPYFSCRGYASQSEMWQAVQRFTAQSQAGKECIILYLGDHDPSGIDMTRDIRKRLEMLDADVTVKRIALSKEQINTYNPPPNPAKVTDTRSKGYIEKYGAQSWELDALNPQILADLITSEILKLRDDGAYIEICNRKKADKDELQMLSERYQEAIDYLRKNEPRPTAN